MQDEEEVKEEGQEGEDVVDFEGEEVQLLINPNRTSTPGSGRCTEQTRSCFTSRADYGKKEKAKETGSKSN